MNFTLPTVLLSLFCVGSSLTAMADDHDVTVRPSLEKHIRFSYDASTSTGKFVSGYPKDYTSVSGSYELNYRSGMVALQEYTFPSDVDWDAVQKITIQSTVTATSNGYAAYWLYDADASSTYSDATKFGAATVSAIGITPGTASGTVNADAVTSYVSRTQVDANHYTEIAEISGDKLTTLISKLRDDKTKIAFVATRQGATSNSKKYLWSSNEANGDYRPVIYIDYYPVKNATKKTAYSTLNAAINDVATDSATNVIQIYHDVTLDARTGLSNKTLTIVPMKDNITLKRGSLATSSIWLLTNQNSSVINLGSADHQLIVDGESASLTNSLLGCEKGAINVTNVKFQNFAYGTSGNLGKTGGTLTLKDVEVADSKTETQFFSAGTNKDKLVLSGNINFTNCTGTDIFIDSDGRIKANSDLAATTPISIQLPSTVTAGTLTVLFPNSVTASTKADLFNIVNDNIGLTTGSHKYEFSTAEAYTATIGDAKASTLVLPFEAVIPSAVKAYTLTASSTEVNATEVSGNLTANTPVLLNAEAGSYKFVSTTTATSSYNTTDTPTQGALTGVYQETTVPSGSYILYNGTDGLGFYKADGSTNTVAANRAYLTATAASAKSLKINYSGTTNISNITNDENANAPVYNIQGMRMGKNLPKGIYIKNGKKFVVK